MIWNTKTPRSRQLHVPKEITRTLTVGLCTLMVAEVLVMVAGAHYLVYHHTSLS